MPAAHLEIPKDILEAAGLSLEEAKVELAVHLYATDRLSIGKARELAGMSLWAFRQLLANRRLHPHYNVEDLEDDVSTLRDLGRLPESIYGILRDFAPTEPVSVEEMREAVRQRAADDHARVSR